MTDYIQVRSMIPSLEEAERIAAAVVETRLAAAVHIAGPVRSSYWWRGEIHHAEEYLFTANTTSDRFGELAQAVRAIHSYEVPSIIAMPISEGTADYLYWVGVEVHTQGAEG